MPDQPNPERAKYLQNISQKSFNIREIIRVYRMSPVKPDKTLSNFYFRERNDLINLIGGPVSSPAFSFPPDILSNSLLPDDIETEEEKELINEAQKKLKELRDEVQAERALDPTYEATTGVEPRRLKEYLEELSERKTAAQQVSFPTSAELPRFSFEDNWLNYGGRRLTISTKPSSNPCSVLRFLAKNPRRVWNCDELWAKLTGYSEGDYDRREWKKGIYNPAYALQKKIAEETTVKDFLVINTEVVQINPKYL